MLDRYVRRLVGAAADWRLILHRHAARIVVAVIHRFDWHLIEISLTHRIGHLCVEADCFLKERILAGTLPGRIFLARPATGFANDAIVTYLKTYITIFDSRFLQECFKLAGLRSPRITKTHPYASAIRKTCAAHGLYARWGDRPPLFRLTPRDRRFGEAQLRRMGVPAGAWFVCLHARAPGYSPRDESDHSYRNVDIEDYSLAIDAIVARGGWCIRLGDPSMPPMRPRPNVIDYALSPFQSARMDVFLGATCRFLLGCASGPCLIATLFGRPCVAVNLAPLSTAYSFGVEDIAIPQRVQLADGRIPSFQEVMTSSIANLRVTSEFEARGVTLIRNTPEEIRDVVLEMLERLDGRAVYDAADDARQDAFRALFTDGHYSYKAGSRIGRDFLRQHMPL